MANRMYYAAYLEVREAIRAQTGDQTFDATHTALAAALARAVDPGVQAVGARLESLKQSGKPRTTKSIEVYRRSRRRFTLTTRGTCSKT